MPYTARKYDERFTWILDSEEMSTADSDDCGSLNSNISIMQVRAAELYPKKGMVETHESSTISPPFAPLCGESIEYMGRTSDGILAVSNYRLYHQRSTDGKADHNIPLGLIELLEVRDLFYIYISCKDARTCRCGFLTNEACLEWYRRLNSCVSAPRTTEQSFAFVYYAWARDEKDEVMSTLGICDNFASRDIFKMEFERMKFEAETCWRVTHVNKDYKLCPSYPKTLIVPAKITDQILEASANFRSARRIPAVVWRHKENGMIIARCSQPTVGWLAWRSSEDQELLKAMAESCSSQISKLLIMDARSYTTAVANRARGGGFEFVEYYGHFGNLFMNLANIHSIRKSFHALRQLCASPADQQNWHSMLEGTRWLQNMSLLIQAAVRAVTAIEKDVQPVLVHCSDGWDRTSQIVSLAELLLDPYYRTIEGFQVLVEKEWLDFGHKFEDRCGIGEDLNEKCPVFLQWLDCVHNILIQFPCAFEFSKRYLIKLAEHTYSNLFGTFLCNTSAERSLHSIANKTFSVWRYLNNPHFRNYLYNPNHEKILCPRFNVRDLEVWRELYIDLSFDNQTASCSKESDAVILNPDEHTNGVESGATSDHETENGNLQHLGNNLGSMLESAIKDMSESGSPKSYGFDKMSDRYLADAESENLPDTRNNIIPEDLVSGEPEPLITLNQSNDDDLTRSDSTIKFNDDILIDNRNKTNDSFDICEKNCNGTTLERDDDFLGKPDNNLHIDIANGNLLLDEIDSPIIDYSHTNGRKNSFFDNNNCDIQNNGIGGICDSSINGSSNADSIVYDLEKRLHLTYQNGIDTPGNGGAIIINDTYDSMKNLGKKYSETLSFINGRHHNSSTLFLDPVDGLPLISDDIQDRMQQISIENKARTAALETELHTTRISLLKAVCHQCNHTNNNNMPVTLPERPIIVDDDRGSVCSTEVSWEAIEEKETQPTLWMPDHAVNQCMNCDNKFWLGRRKHHCRNCGKIFCADCSNNLIPLPNEQLYEPVRVCELCYRTSSCIIYSISTKQTTTCKQAAAGEEPQNSNPVLPPTPPI